MALQDLGTEQVIPKEAVSLIDWINATIRSVYPERGNCLSTPINAKWNTPDKVADKVHMEGRCTRLYSNWDNRPPSMPIIQAMINAAIDKGPMKLYSTAESQFRKPYQIFCVSFFSWIFRY